MSEYKDWRGTPIEVGSLVIFSQRLGKVTHHLEGRVTEIRTRVHDRWDDWRKTEHSVPTPKYALKVEITNSPRKVGKKLIDTGVVTLRAAHGVTVIG